VVHPEVEEVPLCVVEETSNIKTPIILDMDKTLAITNRTMEINSNNILSSTKIINNIRRRKIINLLNNINFHRDLISILHLVTCRLRSTLNLKYHNTDNNPDSQLDKIVSHYTGTKIMPIHHPEENEHETKLSETQTEDIP
jgi:hypothetical protein